MGAGYVSLREKRKKQQSKLGCKEEGSNQNRPELAAFVLALRGTPVTKPMLYLFNNQALLKTVQNGVEKDGRATLVARRRHFTRSNQRASKKNNSRSSDISGQSESASRRTCK